MSNKIYGRQMFSRKTNFILPKRSPFLARNTGIFNFILPQAALCVDSLIFSDAWPKLPVGLMKRLAEDTGHILHADHGVVPSRPGRWPGFALWRLEAA